VRHNRVLGRAETDSDGMGRVTPNQIVYTTGAGRGLCGAMPWPTGFVVGILLSDDIDSGL